MDPWWTAQQAGLLGGIGGVVGGLLGTFHGLAGSYLVPRGLGRRTVIAVMVGTATFGFALLVVGSSAEIAGQPFYVYYVPLLMGGLLYCLEVPAIPGILSRYRVTESMRRVGLQPNVLGDRAAEVAAAAMEEAWNARGDLHRGCRRLLRANLAIGVPALLLGLAFLLGTDGSGWIAPTVVGGCLLACAGSLWMMRRRHTGWVGPGAESRRLAAEELRRS